MPDNRQAQDNAVSNQSTDNIEEAIQRLKIHDNHDGGVVQSSPYPDRPGEPDCLYYLRTGLCGYGSNCRFNHPAYAAQGAQHREELPERVGQPDCGYFLKTGTCKYGSTCKYHHPKDRNGAGPVTFNVLGLPMRQDEKSCPYYMRTGSCKYGVACKFHHPQPASASYGSGLPANGSMGSSVLQSSGLPYVSGLPTWSLPRAPYVSGSQLPSPQGQGYLPVLLSPSQGMLPAQGWSTYIGNLNSASSASTLGSNLLYGSVTPTQSGAVGQTQLISTSSSSLPERPDQPECRYYMNTGTCKYGSDCKYHHPRERTTNPVADTIGPLGLPLRPGQAVCSNYSMYGICKYGPTCRYDHPFVGYSYGYGLSLPPLSVLDSSFLTYPRMSAIPHLSESSLSSKLPDWSQSPNSASEKYRNSESKNPDDATEQGGSPHSLQASSETSQD